ncbi:uncharacterized protein LOC106011198, partial [Aplysia californica]|uniref:Uncharacterized protein LOC106011198 n=1 Tax=Aplysia californica TaxID=6500 RepID=A0ABM1VQ15_APLCA
NTSTHHQAYPVLLEVADHFGPENVQLKVHLFPLPYHRNSHVMSKETEKGAKSLSSSFSIRRFSVSDEAIDSATRLAWKYGCTRGVYGTPLFTVNDVFVQAQDNWTVAQWVALIKPLLL